MPPKAYVTKKKTDKADFTKNKDFCALKGTIKKVKGPLTEWEETFTNHRSD